MTPSDFKKGFSAFEIALYDEAWLRHSHLEQSLGSTFEYIVDNPIEQDVIISLDQTTARMILKGCKKSPGNYYAIYLYNREGKAMGATAIPF